MKEHPILFSAPMVRAILDGRKTQTRRVVLPQPFDDGARPVRTEVDEAGVWRWWNGYLCHEPNRRRSPFGQVGDRLWVRETFYCDHYAYPDAPIGEMQELLCYRADGEWNDHIEDGVPSGWRPSIHMPRWASRISLEVTDVRVERIQSISYGDVLAEGCPTENSALASPDDFLWYECVWNTLNEQRGFGWHTNPWVWVVEFKQLEVAQAAA